MKFEIIPEKNLIVERFSGVVTYDRLVSFMNDILRDPQYSPEMNGIADLSEADLSLTYEEMYSFVEWMRSRPQRATGSWAFVTKTPLTLGISRIFSGLGEDLQAGIEYFGTFEEAMEWIEAMGREKGRGSSEA